VTVTPSTPARRTAATLAAVPLSALVALTGCGSSSGSASAAPPAAGKPSAPAAVIAVGVQGTAFTGVPPTVRPGTATVSFTNATSAVHMAALARLAAGHAAADIVPFLASPAGRQGPPAWLSLVGGVDELDPGHSGSWTGVLAPGRYALVSFSSDRAGRPEVADGMLAPFTVEGSPGPDAVAPPSGGTVTLGAGGKLTMTAVAPGATGLRLVNADGAARTVDITLIKPGRTFEDVVREAGEGHGVPPSLIRLGGTSVPAHGSVVAGIEAAARGTTYVVFDLDHVAQGAIAHETVG
jgi:hypothetical protein